MERAVFVYTTLTEVATKPLILLCRVRNVQAAFDMTFTTRSDTSVHGSFLDRTRAAAARLDCSVKSRL